MSSAQAQLAMWIEQEHPEVFSALYAAAIRAGMNTRPARLAGCACGGACGMGGLGDDLTDVAPGDADYYGPAVDYTSSADMAQQAITTTDPIQAIAFDTNIASAPSGGDILSSAGAVGGAAESVGAWATTAAGLTALTNIGTAVLATSQQQQILAAQTARAQSGRAPLPITYAVTPNGSVAPVYQVSPTPTLMAPSYGVPDPAIPHPIQTALNNGTAQYVTLPDGSTGVTLQPNTLSALFSGGDTWLWLIVGAAVLLAATR